MIINNNIPALNTYRQMGANQGAASKSMEKLASGLRINKAGDDAAGLAISEKMRAQVRGLDQASRNSQDGISMIQTAEGALQETHNILQRMRELATQAANDTNVEVDRNEIQKEMNQLTSEMNRIGNTTEFNTQNILKGRDAEVVSTDAVQSTLVAGEAGVAAGSLTELNTVNKSVVGKASTATVQASTSEATGAVSKVSQTTESVKAEKSTVNLANGMRFESTVADDALNGNTVSIVQGTTAGEASTASADGDGNITITIGQTADGQSLATNRGELYNEIVAGLDDGSITTITVKEPSNTAEPLGTIASTGTLTGGVTEVPGEYTFELTKAFTEAGDTIEVDGKTYTAVFGTVNAAGAARGEFSIAADAATPPVIADQATSLVAAIKATNERFDNASTVNAGGVITLTEGTGEATGVRVSDPTVKGSGEDAKLIITNKNGENLKTITLDQAADDNLLVTADADGNITIALADTTAANNSLEKIEEAIRALSATPHVSGIDFTQFDVKAEGNWDGDANILGNSLNKAVGTLVGGTVEVNGEYNFDIDKAFEAGDTVVIKGQSFTAVEGDAVPSEGQFSIAGGDKVSQAASLADAISLNSELKDQYVATASGTKVTVSEINASGTDLKQSDLDVRATGTQGEFAITADKLLENGAAFVLDGEEITVTNKNEHVGFDNGTAIKATNDIKAQTQSLADAINTNENLNQKYTASVGEDGSLVLQQSELYASEQRTEVSTKNSALGNFNATFQVGANTGQSMTINVEDMRSAALGVSGDGSVGEVKAKNGETASYVQVANVTNGTNNDNVEFALDVSSHEKATAAISVINDAIEKVSAQRSELGSFQNRLEHTISNLGTSAENLQAAESRIRDVDMAREVMEMTKNNILAQASQAMLAQANQPPQGVLQLLG